MDAAQRQAIGTFLRQGEWFAGLPLPLQEALLDRSVVRSYPKGRVIQNEDAPGPGLAAVLEGQVAVLRRMGDGEQALIHVAGPAFWFGQFAVLLDETVFTAVARSDVRLLVLPKREFDRIVAAEPRYYPLFVQRVFEWFRILLRYFAETVQLAPEYRLRLRLAELADVRRSEQGAPGRAVPLDISQAELAQMVGLSRQRLNGRLKALVKEGWIELAPRRIRVLDPNGLRASAVSAVVGDPRAAMAGDAARPAARRPTQAPERRRAADAD